MRLRGKERKKERKKKNENRDKKGTKEKRGRGEKCSRRNFKKNENTVVYQYNLYEFT